MYPDAWNLAKPDSLNARRFTGDAYKLVTHKWKKLKHVYLLGTRCGWVVINISHVFEITGLAIHHCKWKYWKLPFHLPFFFVNGKVKPRKFKLLSIIKNEWQIQNSFHNSFYYSTIFFIIHLIYIQVNNFWNLNHLKAFEAWLALECKTWFQSFAKYTK